MRKIALIGIILTLTACTPNNNWTGYYYPDKDNIGDESQWIIQPGFETIEDCADWVLDVAENNTNYDYECGYNCTYRKELGVNVCETTERVEDFGEIENSKNLKNQKEASEGQEDRNSLSNANLNEELGQDVPTLESEVEAVKTEKKDQGEVVESAIKDAFLSIPDLNSLTPADNGAYYVYGTTSDNCERIVVNAKNPSGSMSDNYELETYKKGDTTFKYGIRQDWNNLALGGNIYTFTAFCEGGQVKEVIKPLHYSITPAYDYPSTESSSLDFIESHIDGDFEGWDGDTVFELSNGQVWQQDSYDYEYHYAYHPEVTIFKKGLIYEMKVEGVDDMIEVVRLK